MRSSAALRSLPPLPSKAEWAKKFPLTTFSIVNRLSSYGGNKPGKRTNVIDPGLADEIVHSLALGKATHVVEAYPGKAIPHGLSGALLISRVTLQVWEGLRGPCYDSQDLLWPRLQPSNLPLPFENTD